ncbi:MAG: DUF2961 domain-containing protein [Verrucomicrobia bacterium]|nr:DUF2961 domain-containing protein [Verrucomicrobiota bacterium]
MKHHSMNHQAHRATVGLFTFISLLFCQAVVPANAQMPAGGGQAEAIGGLQPGLGSLPLLGQGRTRSVSAENPTGEKGKGGLAIPDPSNQAAGARAADDLGQGWKVRPFIRINAGQSAVLMDVKGPGIIQHIWLVENIQAENMSRGMVIRFYWDGEETPSVECPALEFFAVGHGRVGPVNSLAVTVNPRNALSCFWPMPFHQRARVTLTNEGQADNVLVAYQITYVETEVPAAAGKFHAQYRQARTADQNPYPILDGVKGQGRYVGTFMAWTQIEKGWFGEGEVKFHMDGDDKFPTICGTGTEDYFLASFGFPQPYSTAYSGSVLPANENADPPQRWSLYRWHIQDPINFEKDLRVTIQALGWGPKYRLLAKDMIASVAYWYQSEPHAPFPKLPCLSERINLTEMESARIKGALECENLKVVASTPGMSVGPQTLTQFGNGWSNDAHLWVQAGKQDDFVELEVPVAEPGAKRIVLHATRADDYGKLAIAVNGKDSGVKFDGYAKQAAPSGPLDLGVHEPKDGKFGLRFQVNGTNPESTGTRYFFGLDAVVIEKP